MDVSFQQMSFLGGKWSAFAQGRADKEQYRTAMNECYNSFPVEEGSWVRRPGTIVPATTRNGVFGVVRKFDFTQALPYTLEFTDGHMRVFSGTSLVLEDQHRVLAISTADPAVVTTDLAHGYSTGDQVELSGQLIQPGSSPSGAAFLFNRQWSITVTDDYNFSLADPVTGTNFDGSSINTAGWMLAVAKVLDIAVPYAEADLQNIRVVQDETLALILCAGYSPQQIINTTTNSLGYQTLAFSEPSFFDGPYLDPPVDGSYLTPSAKTGTITLTASAITSINGGQGFLSTDVGRHIRLYSQPAQWATGTSYSAGNNVMWNNIPWVALTASTGKQPDISVNQWALNPTGAAWTWAIIESVVSTSEITAALQAADPLGVLAGGPLLYTTSITQWQLGVYSASSVWPSGGTYHEGRFWLFSSLANRLDSTMSDNGLLPEGQGLKFTPTCLDGTVADDCGISAIFQAQDLNTIFWSIPDHAGIVVGTQAGEWVVSASSTNDILTPNSAQAHRMSKFGCAFVQPISTPLATLFVQRYNRKVVEYLADVFSGRFIGTNLAINAKDLTINQLAEVAYQQETVPLVWTRDQAGGWEGMTYKRENPFGTQAASFFGWHWHQLGSNRTVVSIQGGPSPGGDTDSLAMVTKDPVTGIYFVEMLAPIFEENGSLLTANFLDGATVPTWAEINDGNLIIYGLNYVSGDTLTAWIGGIDAGDFSVPDTGIISIPLPAGYNGSELLTQSYLSDLSANTGTGAYLNVEIQVSPAGNGLVSPVAELYDYTSTDAGIYSYACYETVVFDWDKGVFYQMQSQYSGDPGSNGRSLWVFDIATQALVAGPIDPGAGLNSSGDYVGDNLCESNTTALGPDGNIYWGLNTDWVCGRFNVTTLQNEQGFFDNDDEPLDAAGAIVMGGSAAEPYLFYNSMQSGTEGARINVIYMGDPAPQWTGTTFTVSETPGILGSANCILCRGESPEFAGQVMPSAYVVAFNGYPANQVGHTDVAGVYRVTAENPGLANMTRTGQFVPSDIVNTWTSFAWGGLLFDETDNNLISYVQGSDGSTTTYYMIKINPISCTLIWKLSIASFNGALQGSRIRHGRLNFLDGGSSPYSLKTVNTLTGSVVSTQSETLLAPNIYGTDDKTGIMVFNTNDSGTTQWQTFGPNSSGSVTPAVVYNSPALIGFNYVSKGQILRPIAPQEAGTQNGPSLGKTRREHMYAMLLANTQMIQVSSDFVHTSTVPLTGGDQNTPLPLTELFTGVTWDTVDDDYSFDSMLAWNTVRPYPANVLAVGEFLHGEDR